MYFIIALFYFIVFPLLGSPDDYLDDPKHVRENNKK